jgi:hypothetical protein
MVEEHPKNLSLLTSPRNDLSAKKKIATINNGCKTYFYGKKKRHDRVKICRTWQL